MSQFTGWRVSFFFFLDWHRIQLLNVLWLLKRLLNISGQQSQGGATLPGRETSYVGDICYKIRSVLVYGFCRRDALRTLYLVIVYDQDRATFTDSKFMSHSSCTYGSKASMQQMRIMFQLFLYTHAAWLFQMHLLGLMLLYPLNIQDPIMATPLQSVLCTILIEVFEYNCYLTFFCRTWCMYFNSNCCCRGYWLCIHKVEGKI